MYLFQGLASEDTLNNRAEFFRKLLLKQTEMVHCENKSIDEPEETMFIWEVF